MAASVSQVILLALAGAGSVSAQVDTISGVPGCWYAITTGGVSCEQHCAGLGGTCDADNMIHTGSAVGQHFWPDASLSSNWAIVECYQHSADTLWGANGKDWSGASTPCGYTSSQCHFTCACMDVPGACGNPSAAPTATPTEEPTSAPTDAPTDAPTLAPTLAPTEAPTAAPTLEPTSAPTDAPTDAPTLAPTLAPTEAPTAAPTLAPTAMPTAVPTSAPTEEGFYWATDVFCQEHFPSENLSQHDTASVRCCDVSGEYAVTPRPCQMGTHHEAVETCTSINMTLCTSSNVFLTCGTGCLFNHQLVWTKSSAAPAVATTENLIFGGDFASVVGNEEEEEDAFLAECSQQLFPVHCVAVEEGSILVTLGSENRTALDRAVEDITSNGLGLPSYVHLYLLGHEADADSDAAVRSQQNVLMLVSIFAVVVAGHAALEGTLP